MSFSTLRPPYSSDFFLRPRLYSLPELTYAACVSVAKRQYILHRDRKGDDTRRAGTRGFVQPLASR